MLVLRKRRGESARLCRAFLARQGKRQLLLPIYGWFTEGFDTLDLNEAKALLNVINVNAPHRSSCQSIGATNYNPLTKR